MQGSTETSTSEADAEWFRGAAYPQLRRFAAVVAPLDLEPDDLLQEALARALRAGPMSRLDEPLAYLRRTMTNLVSNHNRSRGRQRRAYARVAADLDDGDTPTFPSDLADLERLTPADRAAVYLADVEGLALAEVARVLDIRPPAARARVSRARRRLRAALATDPSTEKGST